MKISEEKTCIEKYDSVLSTVQLLASEGRYELALELIKQILEKLYLEKEIGEFDENLDSNDKLKIESLLTQKYIEFRLKVEGGDKPYRRIFYKTAIICGTISMAVTLTFSILFFQVESFIRKPINTMMDSVQEVLKQEAPRITNELKAQIPALTKKVKEEMPKFSRELSKITDEKIQKIVEKKVEKIADEKLSIIVGEKLEKMAEQNKKMQENKKSKQVDRK